MTTKYRRKVIDDSISTRLQEIFVRIAEDYNVHLVKWNHDEDHVHVLFKSEPNSNLTKFIGAYKAASSRLIKKEFPQIKQRLWKEFFWSRSFCLISTGGVTSDIIKEYIEQQGEDKTEHRDTMQDLS